MAWEVIFHPAFEAEHADLPIALRRQITSRTRNLRQQGPALGRPYADTLIGSRHSNMKELRFTVEGGGWRIAFAFDTNRQAILLLVGDKREVNERRFYRRFIRVADARFDQHLAGLE